LNQLQPLPNRVQRAIQNQHESSEILLAWVQLAVVGLFATFYFIAPKTFAPDAVIKPVPWILAGYFTFTLLRLILAKRQHLPLWLTYLAGVVDVLLLLAMIWSFHLQYMQPPGFYLKAPSLLYIFIFIALRALYFDYKFLAVTGTTAAVGWIAMVLYVVYIGSSKFHDHSRLCDVPDVKQGSYRRRGGENSGHHHGDSDFNDRH